MATEKTDLPKSRLRSLLSLLLPFAIVLVATIISLRFVRSGVPADLTLLTGPQGSKFYKDGLRYKEQLAENGINVHVVVTAGSTDNLHRLIASEHPAAGFCEAGSERPLPDEAARELVSLGSLYADPAWLFYRREVEVSDIESLAGKRVVVGIQGSGARTLSELLIEANGIEDEIVREPFDDLGPTSALQAITTGKIDAMFITGPPDDPVVFDLLESQAVLPMSFRRAPAYARRIEYVTEVDLPEGTVDFALNVPHQDLKLVSLATNLIISKDLHPSMVDLLLSAGSETHGGATLFNAAGAFPNAQHTSLPLHPAAKRFFEDGPSPIHKLVPFWLASLIDRFLFVICTVATASVAAFSILPRLLTSRFNLSLMLLYKQLARIENSIQTCEDKSELFAETDKLLASSERLRPPSTAIPRYLEFRQSVHDLRDRLR